MCTFFFSPMFHPVHLLQTTAMSALTFMHPDIVYYFAHLFAFRRKHIRQSILQRKQFVYVAPPSGICAGLLVLSAFFYRHIPPLTPASTLLSISCFPTFCVLSAHLLTAKFTRRAREVSTPKSLLAPSHLSPLWSRSLPTFFKQKRTCSHPRDFFFLSEAPS